MSVPGSNLLGLALSLLGNQSVLFYHETSRKKNQGGQWLCYYAPFIEFDEGSVQPVDKRYYKAMSLDLQKSYVAWFVPDVDAVNLARKTNGSVFEFNNRRYQMVGQTDWFNQDHWSVFLGVDIGLATGKLTNA